MGDILKYVCSLCPVTALSFLDDGGSILLSGEGPILKVFSVNKPALLTTARIFKSQTIHGIICKENGDSHGGRRTLVIWGGFLVRIVHLVVNECQIQIHLGPNLEAPGWVLDGRFGPPQAFEARRQLLKAQVALVTARNALLLLQIPEDVHRSRLLVLSGSRHSILYSAHIKWIAIDRILLASGTAFGEIIVWSCTIKPLPERPLVCQHQILRGHEGSVFGVNISERLPSLDSNFERRFLASCSDDRTIRVWDVSTACSQEEVSHEQDNPLHLDHPETGFQPRSQEMPEGQIPKDMVTMAWAHVSRIWGIRFMRHDPVADGTGLELLSFGEDATCQQWRLSWSCKNSAPSPSCPPYRYVLDHQSTKSFHAGRNIWSMAIAKPLQHNVLVATGGADGKIACFIVNNHFSVLDTASSNSPLQSSSNGLAKRNHGPKTQAKDPSLDNDLTSLGIGQNFCVPTDSKQELTVKVQNSGLLSAESGKDPIKFKFLRSYSLLDERRLLAITDAGSILVISCRHTGRDSMTATLLGLDESANVVFNQSDFTYVQIASSDAFRFHSIISTCRAYEISFLTEADGAIYYFSHNDQQLVPLGRVDGRISYMLCKESSDGIHIAISCLHSSSLTYWTFKATALVDSDRECLPKPSKQIELLCNVVITSMAILDSDNLLILGSRTGTVLIYDLLAEVSSTKPMSPTACFKRIHSEDAVTSISTLSDLRDGLNSLLPLILTTGRNGRYAIHEIRLTRSLLSAMVHIDMITVHELSLVACPTIEGAYFNQSKHLVMYGFLSKHFVVWNESTQSEVLRVDCGGAHRIWTFLPTTHGERFVYTKASQVYLHTQAQMAQQILQRECHGREINAISISPPLEFIPGHKVQLLATGAEDTLIQIFTYGRLGVNCDDDEFTDEFKPITKIQRHTTGIRDLQWSPCGRYLFSSGGCEEFFVWKIRPLYSFQGQGVGIGAGVICEAMCPKQNAVPDTRITTFCTSVLRTASSRDENPPDKFIISMGYSNSFIRIFEYDCIYRRFTLLIQSTYMSCSITNIHHVFFSNTLILCATSSDGYLSWWDLTEPLWTRGILTQDGYLDRWGWCEDEEPSHITMDNRMFIHQSSVKCMLVIPVTNQLVFIITGGDDCAVSLNRLIFEENRSVSSQNWHITRIHAGGVTAIARLPFSPSCCMSGSTKDIKSESPAGTQLYRYRFATIGGDEILSVFHLTIDPDSRDDLIPCFREHAIVETIVSDISSMGLMEYLPQGATLIQGGIGIGGWRLQDLDWLPDTCPYKNEPCTCSTGRIMYCDKDQADEYREELDVELLNNNKEDPRK